jgi:uncharacterized delta-60 repeat protein
MKKIFYTLILCLLFGKMAVLAQQAGTLDDFLNSGGVSGLVKEIQIQSDGKILIGGFFTSYNGISCGYITRLNATGSLDNTFNPSQSGANEAINLIQIQTNGKIMIAGDFTSYNGVARAGIARLNADGSLDNTFNPGVGANSFISSLKIQTDGKILIAGNFTSYNGTTKNRLARLNADGSLDNTFATGTGTNESINSIQLQTDGKIILQGTFTTYNEVDCKNLIRINVNGSLDNTFSLDNNINGFFKNIQLLANGKVMIEGRFVIQDEVAYVARLNANGSLDNTFALTTADKLNLAGPIAFMFAQYMQAQPDGKVLFWGNAQVFVTNFSIERAIFFIRLNTNGTVDNTFSSPTEFSWVYNLKFQSGGKIIASGSFDNSTGVTSDNLIRLNTNGTPDNTFNNEGLGTNAAITALEIQKDGKTLFGGDFSSFNGLSNLTLIRLNKDGSLDQSLNAGDGFSIDVLKSSFEGNLIEVIKTQADGKILVGGDFTVYNNTERNGILRLNADGSLDNTFNPGQSADNTVYDIEILPDGKILLIGDFVAGGGFSRNGLTRLNNNGTVDNTFNPENTFGDIIKVQNDGKIIIGQGSSLLRLNADGSQDTGLNTELSVDGTINDIQLQADNKILIGGSFTLFNGILRKGIARLYADGTLDVTFNPGSGFNGSVNTIEVQSDGRILVGGSFSSFNGVSRNNIVRLNPDGTLDDTFNPGDGTNGAINAAQIRPDGRAVLGGDFTKYDNSPRLNIARIYSAVSAIPINLQSSGVENNSFTLHWNKIDDIEAFEVDISDNNFLSILPNYLNKFVRDTTLLVNNLLPGKSYVCRVRAINEQGVSPNSVPLEVVIKPETPQGLTAKPLSINQIQLSWDFDPSAANTYKIQFAIDSAEVFQDITLLNSNTFTHSGLKAGTAYYYRLQAFKNGVFSDFSEVVGANTFTDEIVTDLENFDNGIKTYPNPTQRYVKIDWKDCNFEIHNILLISYLGEKINHIPVLKINEKILQLDVNHLSNGLYFIQLEGKNQKISRKLLIHKN